MDILLLYIDITGYPLSECRIWAMISFLSFLILFCQILASVSGLSSSLQAQQPRCNSRKEAELLESAGQACAGSCLTPYMVHFMSACTEHSLLPPRDVLSRLSSSPGAANADVRRAAWRFYPLSPCFPDPSAQGLPGRSERCSPARHLGVPALQGVAFLSSCKPSIFWPLMLLTHCGLHGIGKTFGGHQRPSSTLKTTLKDQFSSRQDL